MSNIYQCKSSATFHQAFHNSNISIGNNSFGLTRMGMIFVGCETILKFLVLLKNERFGHADALFIWNNSFYVCEPDVSDKCDPLL